ncbi:MAG: DUF58 domain-containing protein [Anaerolineaceae bacterium]|nr:DUF58 domain-containing protein [Anaerolineaceae bacterium]
MKIGRSFWWVVGLLVISIIARITPGLSDNIMYLRLVITWGLMIVLCFIWTAFSLTGVHVQRRARILRHQVGQTFIERFDLINRSSIYKLWIKIEDQSDLPNNGGSRILTGIGRGESRSYSSYNLLSYRGIYNLGPTYITSGDIFGLFTLTKRLKNETQLLVLPYLVEINSLPAPFGSLPGGRALRRKTTEVTPYSAGVREYMPGDPLRRIHWPTSARKQTLIVKEFEKDPLAEIWIFVDVNKANSFELVETGTMEVSEENKFWMGKRTKFNLPPSTLEYSISAAASIAKYYIYKRREVGLSASGQIHALLHPERGERQFGKILDTLSLLKAEGKISLYELVSPQISSLVRGSTIILITSSAGSDVIATASEIVQHGMLPLVVLIDQESFGGQSGSVDLELLLESRNIPVTRVTNGADLASALGENLFRKSQFIGMRR